MHIFKMVFQFCFILLAFVISPATSLTGQIAWNTPGEIAPSTFGNYRPRIGTDRAGNPLIIWSKTESLYFTRWDGSTFADPVRLNPTGTPSASADWMGPDIAAHGDTVYVVYKQTPEHHTPIWCMRSFDGGKTFSVPVQVDNIGDDDQSRFPTVTTDDEGQPIIAFMRFNENYLEARWVVTRSFDFGETFTPDVLASGWSGPSSDVCDCCPGAIHSSGEYVTVVYRDNNDNLRDSWVGVSTDGGITFNGGVNVDQNGWEIQACPATGPDGVIVGDTLYSTFMNGASGKSVVYYNKTSLSAMSNPPSTPVPGSALASQQNYSRIDAHGESVALLWRNTAANATGLNLVFTSDIKSGFPLAIDTIAYSTVRNGDVAVTDEDVYVVWQDNSTSSVRYRFGTYDAKVNTDDQYDSNALQVFPNPTSGDWHIIAPFVSGQILLEVVDMEGRTITKERQVSHGGQFDYILPAEGLIDGVYFVKFSGKDFSFVRRMIKM